MTTNPLTKTAVLAVPAGVLLAVSGGGALQVLAVIASAALICFAWVRVERSAARFAAGTQTLSRRDNSDRWRPPPPPRRIERRPTGRSARDVRCSTRPPRARARVRRSTRR